MPVRTRGMSNAVGDLYFCEQKSHIERECEQLPITSNVIIAQLDSIRDVIDLRMLQYGFGAFHIARRRFHFQQCAFPVMLDDKIRV